jgi:hypothetical protein
MNLNLPDLPFELINKILIMRPTHPIATLIKNYFIELERRKQQQIDNNNFDNNFDNFEGNWWHMSDNSDIDMDSDNDYNHNYNYYNSNDVDMESMESMDSDDNNSEFEYEDF